MTEDQKRKAADSYVTNHPDREVRRMCGHYFRAFMAGCDITKAENDSIEAHNKALLETISRNEAEIERLTEHVKNAETRVQFWVEHWNKHDKEKSELESDLQKTKQELENVFKAL